MARSFGANTEVEKAVVAGDRKALLKVLRAMSPDERAGHRGGVARMNKIIDAARYAYGDATFKGWGQQPTEAQREAAAIAAFLCGTAEDAADTRIDIDVLVELAREFSPPSLPDLATAMMKSSGWQSRIHDVQRLIGEGLSSRPECEEYAMGLMLLFSAGRRKALTFEDLFAADAGLKHALLRIFDVEGTQDVSLASVDKYMRSGKSWAQRLIELSEAGVYARALLIDKALSALERGWIQYRSGWFSSFHEQLAPTMEEMRPHAARYLGLLGSRIPPTVTFTLRCVDTLEAAGVVGPDALLEALQPVFASAVKGHIEVALKVLARVVARDAALAPRAALLIVPALAHDAATLQKQVLKRLAEWDTGGAARKRLADYAGGIAAVNRPALAALTGAGSTRVEAVNPKAAAPRVPSASGDPLAAAKPLVDIEEIDELIERTAYVFENDTDIDEFERVLGTLMRHAPFDDMLRQRFAPLSKRVPRLRKPVALELARVLQFCLTGERGQSTPSQDFGGRQNLAQRHLIERIDELLSSTASAGLGPLATPTHRRGFIEPATLVARLAARQKIGREAGRRDLCTALLRLAPSGVAVARRSAAKLADDSAARALRFALGDDVKPPGCAADDAARMRVVLAGAPPTERAWRIREEKLRSGTIHRQLVLDPPAVTTRDTLSELEREASTAERSYWTVLGNVGGDDEASIHYYASILPGDLGGFFAEGAVRLSLNMDWWQAEWQNKAYLRALLPPDVPLGRMAHLLLAVALAGKEPGHTAIAVDALSQGAIDGRLDAKLLSEQLATLVRAGHAACSRYARSLRAALRIDAAVAPALVEILAAVVTARPEDPPKDTASLMELLLEIVLANGIGLPASARAGLEALRVGGKGKLLRQQLLALA